MMSDFLLSPNCFGSYTMRLWILLYIYIYLKHIYILKPLVVVKHESQIGVFVQLPAVSTNTTFQK